MPLAGDDITDEGRLPIDTLDRLDHGPIDAGKPMQGVFDFRQVNAVAADLHAMVLAAAQLQQPVGIDATQIPVRTTRAPLPSRSSENTFAVSAGSRQ
jgi:hypothetical protein